MWDLIVSLPDHCLSFYFVENHTLKNPPRWCKKVYWHLKVMRIVLLKIKFEFPKLSLMHITLLFTLHVFVIYVLLI